MSAPEPTTPKITVKTGNDGRPEVMATSPAAAPAATATMAAPPLRVRVDNFPAAADPTRAIVGAVVAAIIGAYLGQRFAHGYALKRAQTDREQARRDRRHDEARKVLGETLGVIAAEQKRLEELRATTWERRSFFRNELKDSSTVDKEKLKAGAELFNEDQQKSIETGRVVRDLRPRLELYFEDGHPVLTTFDDLGEVWKQKAFSMLVFDEQATTKSIVEQVAAAQTELERVVWAFGQIARDEVFRHDPPPAPSRRCWQRRPGAPERN